MPTRRAKVPQLSQRCSPRVPVAAVGAFVDGDLPAGQGGRDGDRRSGLLVPAAERGLAAGAVLQYSSRPTGV